MYKFFIQKKNEEPGRGLLASRLFLNQEKNSFT